MERLVIEEDTIYEIDEECLCQKEEQEPQEEQKERKPPGGQALTGACSGI